jgi:hypothetical protein
MSRHRLVSLLVAAHVLTAVLAAAAPVAAQRLSDVRVRSEVAVRLQAAREPTPTPPRHVVAVQGPTARQALYVHVSWDRVDPSATGYELLRDGRRLAVVGLHDDPWNDYAYVDRTVRPGRTYQYRVKALYADGGEGAWSLPYAIRVRSDAQVGSGRVFRVDAYPGTDLERARAAVADARRAGGGVVLFGPRTYRFDSYLLVSAADDVVLRGAGAGRTVIAPTFAGAGDACAGGVQLVVFRGRLRPLETELVGRAGIGARTIVVTSSAGLRPGYALVLDESRPFRNPRSMIDDGVTVDPGTGVDRRDPWEANEVVRVDGHRITLRYPLARAFTPTARLELLEKGYGNGIELLTLEGRDAQEDTYYKLLTLDHVADFTLADVEARWANRNLVEVRGYDVRLVGLLAPSGGALSFDGESCKYKVSIWESANVAILRSQFGILGSDQNQSFVTIQRSARILVRDSRFYGSRTYALNEHGGGSRDLIFENNYIAAGANARFGGILLGNSSWGFSGPAIIRNNLFQGNHRDLYLQENSYGTRFIDNRSLGNTYRVVEGYGWAGPETDPSRYGSLRLTVRRNSVSGALGDGVVLGAPDSPWYPYRGVRDVVLSGNDFDVAGCAVCLERPERIYTSPDANPPWSAPEFPWETFDRGAAAGIATR